MARTCAARWDWPETPGSTSSPLRCPRWRRRPTLSRACGCCAPRCARVWRWSTTTSPAISDGGEMTPYVAVALTSLVAYVFAVKRLGWQPSDLGRALGRMAESLGAGVIFAVVDVLAAASLVLGLRMLTNRFFSLYSLDDLVWLALSMLQGWAWGLWRGSQGAALRKLERGGPAAASDGQPISPPPSRAVVRVALAPYSGVPAPGRARGERGT